MFDGLVPARGFRGSRPSALQVEDDLADLDLLSLFNLYVAHHAAHGGRNFDDRFIGFELHYRLAFGNARAGRNHKAHQVAGVDVLAKFWQLEVAARSGAGSRSSVNGSRGSVRRSS